MKVNRNFRAAVAGLAWCAVVSAQTIVGPEQLAVAKSTLNLANRGARLRCEIRPVQPALTYSLELRAGYIARIPLDQSPDPGHSLSIFLRVTPEHGDPVYLSTEGKLPDLPESQPKVDAEIPGSFLVGEGTYSVEALVKDDAARTCYNLWRIQAKRTGNERELPSTIPSGAVRDFATASEHPPAPARSIDRLTLLVNAAGRNPRAAKMEDQTIRDLTDSLSAILTRLPAKSVRLIVFSLEKQAVLFRKDSFGLHDLEAAARAMEQVELAVVDVNTLASRLRTDVLADLLAQELRDSPTAVIVLSPHTESQIDPSLTAETPGASGIRWFYLQYQNSPTGQMVRQASPSGTTGPLGGRAGAGRVGGIGLPDVILPPQSPDGIAQLVHRLNGPTVVVYTPRNLADAIHRMAGEIPTVNSPAPPPASELAAAPPAPPAAVPTGAPEPTDYTGDQDPVEILARLRDTVLKHASAVPNHTCVETVVRDSYVPRAGPATKSCDALLGARSQPGHALRLDLTDWLRLDVGMSDGNEIFSWAGEPKFSEAEIDELIPEGSFGTGPYAATLLAIFENRDPHFVFDGETSLAHRRLLQYSFHVPRPESTYRVKARNEWIVAGYTGTLLLDPQTSELVRFLVRSEELPSATQACEIDVTLEYNMVSLGGFEYLLPKSTRQRFIGTDGSENENRVSFASCREFLGESTLTFGKARIAPGNPAFPPATLPDGLSLAIELTTPFTLGEAAAGDRIEGRLVEPLRDPNAGKVIAPAGAKVAGRLTRVELRPAGNGEYTVVLRWLNLEIGGNLVPVNLKPSRPLAGLPSAVRGTLQRRGVPIDLPRPGEGRDAVYHFPGATTRVDSGLRTQWITSSAH